MGGPRLAETEDELVSDAVSTTSTDELLLQCLACGNLILKADDIVSSNYRIMTGPAYLTSSAYNVRLSSEPHTAAYTSGRYTVREVACLRCSARLGITYVGAAEMSNQYKVGKFLMGQDQLLLSPSGVTLPKGAEGLFNQLLELLRNGSTLPMPAPSLATAGPGSLEPTGPGPEPAAHGDRDPLVVGDAEATPQRRLLVTIKRYLRCLLPAARLVPGARPWAGAGRRQAPASTVRHAPQPVPQAPQ